MCKKMLIIFELKFYTQLIHKFIIRKYRNKMHDNDGFFTGKDLDSLRKYAILS